MDTLETVIIEFQVTDAGCRFAERGSAADFAGSAFTPGQTAPRRAAANLPLYQLFVVVPGRRAGAAPRIQSRQDPVGLEPLSHEVAEQPLELALVDNRTTRL